MALALASIYTMDGSKEQRTYMSAVGGVTLVGLTTKARMLIAYCPQFSLTWGL
jgi:hypothetical protein